MGEEEHPLRPPLHNSSSPRDKEPKDIEKLLKWQQDRMARKLRGEYESAVVRLSELINDNVTTPMNISSVRIEGATHTRKSFLALIINPNISSQEPTTVQDVLHATRRISNALTKTDIFSSVEAFIDRPRGVLAQPGDVDLILKTKERGRWYLTSSTELGNNEGSANALGRIRNVFGGAETFEANVAFGTKTRRAFRASLTTPLSSAMTTFAELSAFGMEKDLTAYASCTEAVRGIRAVVRHGNPNQGAHELVYEGLIRHIAGLSETASLSVREASGLSTKSSLSHALLYDTRDDRLAATRGVYGKLYQELAGLALGGDSNFYKIEVEGQTSRKLRKSGVSISLAAKSGLLWGLGPAGKTLFPDRFQLGGPTSVRSFKSNGMGPRDGDDSLGGELYYSAGASLISNIPFKPHWPVKTHAWVNGGRLDMVDRKLPLKSTLFTSLSRPSISVGLGLIYRFDPVRIEVNFGMPLVSSRSDGTRKGVQVGIGLEFL